MLHGRKRQEQAKICNIGNKNVFTSESNSDTFPPFVERCHDSVESVINGNTDWSGSLEILRLLHDFLTLERLTVQTIHC